MKARIPWILVAVYLLLVLVACVPIFTGEGPLAGVFALLLTSPWAPWIGRLLPEGSTGGLAVGLGLVAAGAAINALLLYALVRWLAGIRGRPE